jgi:hypothetical protein
MSNIILIFVCLFAGIRLQRVKSIPADSHKILNAIIINISLPALALLYIPQIVIDKYIIFPLTSMWIVFGIAIAFFAVLSKILKLDRKTTGALIMTAGLCNSSFVGFPVLMTIFGEEGLKIGVIIDQAGSFTVLATVGVIVSSVFSAKDYNVKNIIKDILKYPPFIAFVIGLILRIINFEHGELSKTILEKLGNLIVLIALISVGLQIKIKGDGIPYKELAVGLFFKLILAPAFIFLLFYIIAGGRGLSVDVSLIESAMPPMVMGSVMAVSYGLNPRLSNLMVGIGIPVSAITLLLWYLLIKLI